MTSRILVSWPLMPALAVLSLVSVSSGEDRRDDARKDRDKPAAARIVQGRIAMVDPAKREIIVTGALSAQPIDPRKEPVKRDPIDRKPTDPAADRTGSGRTGNAPARENSFTFRIVETARITLDGKPTALKDLRPDQFVRVSAVEAMARSDAREPAGIKLALGEIDRGSGDKGRSDTNTGIGGVNTAASADRNIRMTADRVDAFTKPPLDIPPRSDPPKSGTLGTR